jgi:hypothetical protein
MLESKDYLTIRNLSILLNTDTLTLSNFIKKTLKIRPEKISGRKYSYYKCRIIIKEWFVRKKHSEFIVLPSKINKE